MWFWVLVWFFCIITMIVNGFVIFLVCSQRPLYTKTNAFVVSLAVADFGVVIIVVPSRFFCSLTTEYTPRFESFEIFDFNLQQNLLWSNVFYLNH